MKKAIFFDRDGVLNKEIYRKNLKKWTAPHDENEVKINKDVLKVLKELNKKNFLIFIISNQPDYALGMVSLKKLKCVHKKINKILKKNSIKVNSFFNSYKHPKSIKKKYGPPCNDRKPNPFFINKIKKKYKLNLKNIWIIGDRQTDVECGFRAGIKTIGLFNNQYKFDNKKKADFFIGKITKILNIIK